MSARDNHDMPVLWDETPRVSPANGPVFYDGNEDDRVFEAAQEASIASYVDSLSHEALKAEHCELLRLFGRLVAQVGSQMTVGRPADAFNAGPRAYRDDVQGHPFLPDASPLTGTVPRTPYEPDVLLEFQSLSLSSPPSPDWSGPAPSPAAWRSSRLRDMPPHSLSVSRSGPFPAMPPAAFHLGESVASASATGESLQRSPQNVASHLPYRPVAHAPFFEEGDQGRRLRVSSTSISSLEAMARDFDTLQLRDS